MDDEESCSEESVSEEEPEAIDILERDVEDGHIFYRCLTSSVDSDDWFDRSDLMDAGAQQAMVLKYEKRHPPDWGPCPVCCGDIGCDECMCDQCERECRFIDGVNYGCEKHPVI